jgi:hypothetical protein
MPVPVMNEDDFFAELRSLTQAAPTHETWAKIARLEARTPSPEFGREIALPYLSDHLQRWPQALDSTRTWTEQWIVRVCRDSHDVPWPADLCRSLVVTPQLQLKTQGRALGAMIPWAMQLPYVALQQLTQPHILTAYLSIAHPILERLTVLSEEHVRHDLTTGLIARDMPRLKELMLMRGRVSSEFLKSQPQWGHNIQALHLVDMSLSSAQSTTLLKHNWPGLKILNLHHNPFEFDTLEAISTHNTLQNLESLHMGHRYGRGWHDQPSSALELVWNTTSLPSLNTLKLEMPRIPAHDVEPLLRKGRLDALKTLELHSGHPITQEQATRLRAQVENVAHKDLLLTSIDLISREHAMVLRRPS